MKISVIVPLYNTRAYIREAIDSILAQTLAAHEIVVIDDGSTDGGTELLEPYGAAVRVIRQDHAGPAKAVNCGIRETRGDAIAFLDADDLWTRDKLRLQMPLLAADRSVDGLFGHMRQFAGAEFPATDSGLSEAQPGISRITLLIRRSAIERFGLFDDALRTSDFVPWYSRAVALGLKTRMLADVLAYRRLHGANTGLLRRHDQQQESLIGLKRALDIRRRQRAAAAPVSSLRQSDQD